MKISNKHNLPEILVKAVQGHIHTSGFISASQTTISPREFWLRKRHHGEITEDASDRVWALFGTMLHHYLEQFADNKNEISEKYLEVDVLGQTFSGSSDLYQKKDCKIVDFKTTSIWTIIYKDRIKEWEKQLNMYAYLFRKNDYPVNQIEIIAILRDWQSSKVNSSPEYPDSQVVVIPIKLWSEQEQENYITQIIGNFLKYENTSDDKLPECSNLERWATADTYAVIKDKAKRAMRVFEDMDTAKNYAENQVTNGLKVKIDYRPGESKKCQKYCSVNNFCNQYTQEQKNK